MFNNLIESQSHVREFKRRGRFLLATTAAYGLLFFVAGIASIYAYDARLDAQNDNLEVLNWVPPLKTTEAVRPREMQQPRRSSPSSARTSFLRVLYTLTRPSAVIACMAPLSRGAVGGEASLPEPGSVPGQVLQDPFCRQLPRRAHHAASGMGAGAALVVAIDRGPVLRPPRRRPEQEHLGRKELAGEKRRNCQRNADANDGHRDLG